MRKKKPAAMKPAAGIVRSMDSAIIGDILQQAERDVLKAPEPSAEGIAGIVNRLETLSPISQTLILRLFAQEGGENALTFLEVLAQSQNTTLAAAAVDALGAVRSPRAIELLVHVVENDPNRELRKVAKRSLFRLKSLGVPAEAPAAKPKTTGEKYPVVRSIVSSFDGQGTRAIMFAIQRPLGGVDRIVPLLNASRGLIECFGTDDNRKALFEEMDNQIKKPEHGMLWADAPADYCRQLVEDALALNRKHGTPLPRGYYYWRDEIGHPTNRYERPLVYQELHTLEVKWDPTLLEQSGEQLDLHEFDSWAFEPAKVQEAFSELQQMQRSGIALPGWSQKEREEAVMKRFFAEFVTPDEQARYKFEMEEIAYILLRHDRRLDARRCLAVAVGIDEFRNGDLVKIPFMRDLFLKSLALLIREQKGEEPIHPREFGIITPEQFMR